MFDFREKLMIISNFIFFITFILSLVFRNIAFVVFGIIINLFLFYVYIYYKQEQKKIKENLNNNNQDIINNKLCVKPSKDNPFMNPTIVDIENNKNANLEACHIDNLKIRKDIDKYFINNQFRDVKDIYEKNISQRQFYTMPSTTIPNNQNAFAHWLYHREKTCKENNGEQCFNNIM